MILVKEHTIYTIGHSTHSIKEFIEILFSFDIKMIADIRRFPGSRKFPQFDQDNLKQSLQEVGIQYLHLVDLGGRRKADKNSKNIRWNNESFRGYADYMETKQFQNAVEELQDVAQNLTTAYMCSEVLWWRCHRSMVSDYLKAKGWTVVHIISKDKAQEHKFTQPARIVENKVFYYD